MTTMRDHTPDRTQLVVNGERTEVAAVATVADLLTALGYGDRMVAVALNRECVSRRAFGATAVREGDEVEILAPMAGG